MTLGGCKDSNLAGTRQTTWKTCALALGYSQRDHDKAQGHGQGQGKGRHDVLRGLCQNLRKKKYYLNNVISSHSASPASISILYQLPLKSALTDSGPRASSIWSQSAHPNTFRSSTAPWMPWGHTKVRIPDSSLYKWQLQMTHPPNPLIRRWLSHPSCSVGAESQGQLGSFTIMRLTAYSPEATARLPQPAPSQEQPVLKQPNPTSPSEPWGWDSGIPP